MLRREFFWEEGAGRYGVFIYFFFLARAGPGGNANQLATPARPVDHGTSTSKVHSARSVTLRVITSSSAKSRLLITWTTCRYRVILTEMAFAY